MKFKFRKKHVVKESNPFIVKAFIILMSVLLFIYCLSLLLPLFTLSVAFISPYLYKKLKNYVFISLLFFAIGAILIVGVLLFLDISWIVVMVLFTMEAIAMGIISNTTTVQVPLTFKGKFDAGFLAGFLNGACYIGTAIATYALGYLADISGWTLAFILLVSISLFSALLAGVYLLCTKSNRKRV